MPPVIVDSSAWIEYFRDPDSAHGDEVERLVKDGDAILVGVVYAELLRGARNEGELRSLDERLEALPFLEAGRETWRRAGQLLFDLRRQGLTIPLTDAVIAALALEGDHRLYTLDEHFQRVPGIRLHQAGA